MRGKLRKVDVECYVFPSDALFLRSDCGRAESDDGRFEMSTNLGSGEPIVRLPDGRWAGSRYPGSPRVPGYRDPSADRSRRRRGGEGDLVIYFPTIPKDGHVVEAWSIVHEHVVHYRWVYYADSACADVPGAPADGRPIREEWVHYEGGRVTGRSPTKFLISWFHQNQSNLYVTEREAILALLSLLQALIESTKQEMQRMGARAVRCRARLRDLPETKS